MLGILYVQNGHNACIAQIKTFLLHALKQEPIMAKYYALTKGLKGLADALHRLRGTRQDLLNMYRKYETTFDEVTGLALKYKKS